MKKTINYLYKIRADESFLATGLFGRNLVDSASFGIS